MQNIKKVNNLLDFPKYIKENQINKIELNLPEIIMPLLKNNISFNNSTITTINFNKIHIEKETIPLSPFAKLYTNKSKTTLDNNFNTSDINSLKLAFESLGNTTNLNISNLLTQYINQLKEPLTSLSNTIIESSNIYKSFCSSFSKSIEDLRKSITSMFSELANSIKNTFPFDNLDNALSNIETWAKYGWVMSDLDNLNLNIFYEKPKNQDEADKIILKYITPNFIDEVVDILSELIKDKETSPTFNIIEEAIFCFKNKKYMACVSTLLPLFDTELVNIQIKENSSCNKKIGKKGVEKLEKYFLNEEFSFIYYFLGQSVYVYLNELYKNTHNFNTSQYNINRNMVLHGMNKRTYTEIDCIKLFNAYVIYILVISNFDFENENLEMV